MKILFYGRTQGNSGPNNVNRDYYAHLTPAFLPAEPGGGSLGLLRDLKKLSACRVLVVSGLSRKGCLLMAAARLLGRRCVYMIHGCAAYEHGVNGQSGKAPLRQERYLMARCHCLLAVSRSYGQWLARRYPEYAGKICHLNPGLPEFPALPAAGDRRPGSILAAGADRQIKNNLTLARAVEELEGAFSLEICGAAYHGDPFRDFRHTRYLGLLPREEYWQKLGQTEIFAVNSLVESFGLSPLEALARGCSVLISSSAGVCDLLPLKEEDIIRDPMDTEELKNKLKWIQKHPNHARLRAIKRTGREAAQELEAICRRLEGGKL